MDGGEPPIELYATVPNYMIQFVPIIEEGEEPYFNVQGFASQI